MSGSMRSAAGRTAAAPSRSAGTPPAGPGRGRSSPRVWRTVTGPNSPRGPQRPGLQPRNRGTSVLGRTRSRHHQLAGARGGLRCDEMAPGRSPQPRRDRRRAGHHHPAPPHARAGRAARSSAACRPLRARVQPCRAGADPGPPATAALAWASDHCLPLTALADPQVTRRALEALALRLDGTWAAATTITRKRAVFHGCLSYAAELRLPGGNPLDRITWKPPRSSFRGKPAVSGHTC